MSTLGTSDGETERKERAMRKNRKSTKKKYPDRPITGKEWIAGYRKWKKQTEQYGSKR